MARPRSTPPEALPVWGKILIAAVLVALLIGYGILSGFLPALARGLRSFTTEALPGLLILAAIPLLYFVPAFVGRHSPRSAAIFLANLIFGWTVVGWFIALIWAVAESGTAAAKPNPRIPPPLP